MLVSDLLKPKKVKGTKKEKVKTSDDESNMMLRLDSHFKRSEDNKVSEDAEEINSIAIVEDDERSVNNEIND